MDTNIETLLRYPLQSEAWLSTVLIGGIALLLSFLLIPLFVVAGYGVRAIRAGMDRAAEPPVFDDWGTLLTEGFVASIIGFVYQLVPTVVFFAIVGLFVWWLLAIAFGYVGVAGVANYAREGRFGAGFDLDTIADVVTAREYLLAWVYVVLLNIAVDIVVTVLNVVPPRPHHGRVRRLLRIRDRGVAARRRVRRGHGRSETRDARRERFGRHRSSRTINDSS